MAEQETVRTTGGNTGTIDRGSEDSNAESVEITDQRSDINN
jgi:hypothetical protein